MDLSKFPWLLRLLGADPAEIRPDADAQLLWRNAPSSWSVFVLLAVVGALCAGVIYLYRREINTCPRGAKWLLSGLRLAVVALLLMVFLDPVVRFDYRRVLEPSVTLLRDASQSMDLGQDRYANSAAAEDVAKAMGSTSAAVQAQAPSRVAIINHLLSRDNERLLRDLTQRGSLRVLDFAGSLEKVALATKEPTETTAKEGTEAGAAPAPLQLPPLSARGTSTDLRRAIQEALSDRLVAAIVLFTDGQHTLRDTAHDELKQAAQQASQRGVPLLIVGVGDSARPRNVTRPSLFADKHVSQGEPFEIRVALQGFNIDDESVEVSLIEKRLAEKDKPEGEPQIVDKKPAKIPAGSGRVEVKFKRTLPTRGSYEYIARAAKLPGEANPDDNESVKKVIVVNEPARVLLVSGGPTWEYQHLMRLLKREKKITVSGWLQNMELDRDQDGTDGKQIKRLPIDDKDFLEYAVIILLDPDPDGLSEAWLKQLQSFVGDHSGGLLFMAGPKHTSQMLAQPRFQPLRTLLPIELKDVRRLEVYQTLDPNNRRWQLGVVPSNADEPILQLGPDATSASTSRWQQLPGFYWSLASDGEKEGAKVLLERADPSASQDGAARPLLVTGMYGGRTAFIGFQGTWRWRRTPEGGGMYDKFWLQTVDYLVEGRKIGGKHRVEIETNRQVFVPGERVSITARMKTIEPGTGKLKPLELPKVTAMLQAPNLTKEPVELALSAKPGEYAGTLVARHQGQHTISIVSPGESGASPPSDKTYFDVEPPSVEREQSWLNKPLLVDLAKLSGGRYFDVGEADQIAAAIPNRKQEITVPGKTLPLRESMRVSLLLTLVGLLGIEWAVRKHYKLM